MTSIRLLTWTIFSVTQTSLEAFHTLGGIYSAQTIQREKLEGDQEDVYGGKKKTIVNR